MIESPPKLEIKNYIKYLLKLQKGDAISSVVDSINNEYKYWSDVKYVNLPEGISSAEELWGCVKGARWAKYNDIWSK